MKKSIKFVFFGTPEFAVIVLERLKENGFLPSLIVTGEDKPQGRHLQITPPPVKVWAIKNSVPFLQPKKLDSEFSSKLKTDNYDLFIVASYGKILPQSILDIPKHQTLNVHPSLLPKLRGPSPIIGAILDEEKTGVTIMRLDSEMDHGPIIVQREISMLASEWPPYEKELETILGKEGGLLLAESISGWVEGKMKEKEQDHTKATYTKKIKKEDAFIDLKDNPELNLRKIRAYSEWPKAFTFIEHDGKKIRLIIKSARIENNILIMEKVIPEGRKEMTYEEFKRGFSNTRI